MAEETLILSKFYPLPVLSGAHAPVDGTTYYFGLGSGVPALSPLLYRIEFPQTGKIRRVAIAAVVGGFGSAEPGSISLVTYDGIGGPETASYLIDGNAMWDATMGYHYPPVEEPECDITVNQWDACNFRVVYPVFATNPTAVHYYGAIWVGP